jgi:hypothetical protein
LGHASLNASRGANADAVEGRGGRDLAHGDPEKAVLPDGGDVGDGASAEGRVVVAYSEEGGREIGKPLNQWRWQQRSVHWIDETNQYGVTKKAEVMTVNLK